MKRDIIQSQTVALFSTKPSGSIFLLINLISQSMDIKVKKLPKSQVQIIIELSTEEVEKHQKQACEKISKEVKIDGFRQGKVPYSVLVEKYGKELVDAETKDIAIQKAFVKAATENEIHPITRPEVKITKESPLTIEITVGVIPEVTITGYEKIKVKKEEISVSDKEIQEVLDHVQRQYATFTEVDRAAKKGDRVEIDMAGYDEGGAELDKVKSKNHPVVIGDKMFVPGFEDNLIGLKKDEEKEFDLVFPKDYHDKSFQKKKVKFKVKVKMIEERKLPEWNEELIEKGSGKKQSLDEFKKEIKRDLTKGKENEAKEKQKNKYLDELEKIVKVEFPEQLIQEEIEGIIHDLKHNLQHRGVTWEKYLEMTKKKEEDIRKENKKEAEKRIRLRFALRELFKKETITANDKELEEEILKIKASYPADQHSEIDKFYGNRGEGREQLMSKILMDKVFAKVLS